MKIFRIIYSFIFTENEFRYILRLFIFFQFKSKILRDFFRKLMIVRYGVFIGKSARINSSIFFPHPSNVVIGEGVIIEDNVTIYQGVTIGSSGKKNKKNIYACYPHINNDVIVYANSTVIGNISIGAESIIGANSFINKTVPENSVCFGNNLIKDRLE